MESVIYCLIKNMGFSHTIIRVFSILVIVLYKLSACILSLAAIIAVGKYKFYRSFNREWTTGICLAQNFGQGAKAHKLLVFPKTIS